MSANEKWIERIPQTGIADTELAPLVARVGLDTDDEFLGTAFYIGSRYLKNFDHPVVSWDTPVARVFFQPGEGPSYLVGHVLGLRSLVGRGNDIVAVFDEWSTPLPPVESPFKVRALTVPSAPTTSPARRRPSPTPTALDEVPAEAGAEVSRVSTTAVKTESGDLAKKRIDPAGSRLREGMRAVEAVQFALEAPRTSALSSVLSTLQPDQYDLVTRAPDVPLLVQGHPGTGKTIVAVHRAAYLVSSERGTDRARRLLMLGPTDEYVRHVSGILHELDVERRVSVKSVPTWLAELAKFTYPVTGELDSTVLDAGRFIKGITDQAAEMCKRERPWVTGADARSKNLERLYGVIRNGGTASERLHLGEHSRKWIPTLPPFGGAVRQKRYLRLFAQASLSILGTTLEKFDHVIVDEAQDVVGLEWEIIRAHNPDARWTLLGDMNQRRTDFGDASWGQLAERLDLGTAVAPLVIQRGYRSTQPILDFAKPLLDREDRTAQSLQQDGPPVTVRYVARATDRDPVAVAEAQRLLAAYPNGTAAIITPDVRAVERSLLSAGWRRTERPSDFVKDGRTLALRSPETARGVEFDGVVVVEPAAFQENLGRHGQLYTSLTRANRELAVVHHAKLPDKLRHHGRR